MTSDQAPRGDEASLLLFAGSGVLIAYFSAGAADGGEDDVDAMALAEALAALAAAAAVSDDEEDEKPEDAERQRGSGVSGVFILVCVEEEECGMRD